MKIFIVLSVLLATAVATLPKLQSQPRRMTVYPKGFLKPEGRIIGGELAQDGQIPYQVGIELWKDLTSTSSMWCGGTLISKRWVLTAAHCAYGMGVAMIYLGAVKRTEAKQIISSTTIYVHEKYDPDLISDDIALIRLPLLAKLSDSVQPVVLPKISSNYSTYEGQTVIASGWGKTSDCSLYIAEDLSYIFRTVDPNCDCALVYGANMVRDTNICLGTVDGTGFKSTCSGDSGGPVVLNDYARTLIGVTSYGDVNNCEVGYPVALTRVTSYLEWIKGISGVSA